MSVGFCTEVSYSKPQTASQKLLGFVDSYLSFGCLGCKRVEVVPGYAKDGKEAVVEGPSRSSYFATVLKIVSYLSVIIPLLALIAKIALRSTHSFYLLDHKQLAEIVLKKVEARKPLSNEDFNVLPLSRLNKDQINSIFNLGVLPAELPQLREKFARIPASEVEEAVEKELISGGYFLLISENQCKTLSIAKSKNVFNAIYASSINPENLHAERPLSDESVCEDPAGIVERVQLKIANIDPDDFESALYDFWKDDEVFYHFFPDQQLMKLQIGHAEFDKKMVIKLIKGLCGRPEMLFGELTDKVIEANLPNRRRRFALLDVNQVKKAFSEKKIGADTFALLASDQQFQALGFDLIFEFFEKFFRTEEENIANSKRLFKLVPPEEVNKAIQDGRLDQDLVDQLNS